ncbi:MAG TPA: SynChlorMet cassette radical SAM/SPASM protein ScmF [Syntrophales bacterium]|nr:SynChlorMet cassette radical SAM/SPASM protein ScmF [Syntrophales bacterium]HOX93881.1 SynChlorMet cassette radical SAM/SPASM protein ScmF [Syntrophales bacterium]HPI56187.1 SynChlorMet cassette radical SAM/SPASM protein ScmF [Syntrophales bacterium]HPN24375.1 SynChlorMet cassette radical SAM/SPASM protein ScmF [Syntrophales bacterium]HQM29005.1 SynChlorMet cassette radical SAM/SPASM protein ScmF [Syntrophales bacterium]
MESNLMEKVSTVQYALGCIYFYLTEGCNLCCRHCWIQPKFQNGERVYPSLEVDLFKSIIAQAKPLGLGSVKLTGGEPLLHPQITDLLEHIKQEGLRLTIETNGVLCTPALARQIASCVNPFVSVSIDGADAETHEWVRGVAGSFRQAIDGARNLVDAGIHPQIIMTIMRRNRDQIEAVVRLAESLRANSVKFNIVQPAARGEKMHEAGETLTIEELVEIGRWVENELSARAGIRLHYSHPAAFRPMSKMFGENGDGCGVCGVLGILGVLGNGSYALCGIGETVPELVFGHAAKDRLGDIWANNPVLKELREGLPHRFEGICGDCVMRGVCLGSCVAQNYYSERNLWAGYWYCEAAKKRGLFPGTRLEGWRRFRQEEARPAM